ncbi:MULTISPECIES: GIY-YIG nuclease family protein [unclassified Streptomyces]|nr:MULTISPECIES: hypothetical protein [unclassified Streptomyces]
MANRTSAQNLRKRVRYHYRGNAAGSTLRLTLGCLLGLELRRVGSGKRMTSGKAGEAAMSYGPKHAGELASCPSAPRPTGSCLGPSEVAQGHPMTTDSDYSPGVDQRPHLRKPWSARSPARRQGRKK